MPSLLDCHVTLPQEGTTYISDEIATLNGVMIYWISCKGKNYLLSKSRPAFTILLYGWAILAKTQCNQLFIILTKFYILIYN